MAARIINIRPAVAGRTKAIEEQSGYSDWLEPWLEGKGLLQKAREVWTAWPPLETASLKLARLLGRQLLDHEGQSLVGAVVERAVLAFRAKRGSGGQIDRAASQYLAILLECGETLVTNRVEAEPPDGGGSLVVWDPSLGPYDDWCNKLPAHFVISNHTIRADEGEYAAGRYMIAAAIMSPAEFSRIMHMPRDSGWQRI